MNEFDENDDSESKLEPTHHSKLDVRKMRVDELRTELMARDMDTRGLKGQLIQRLKEALDIEKVSPINKRNIISLIRIDFDLPHIKHS